MVKVVSSFLLVLTLCNSGFAQVPNPYLFLDWTDADKHSLEVGHLSYTDSFDCSIHLDKEYVSNEQSIDDYFIDLKKQLATISPDKPDVLIYIHGFGAHRSTFVKLNNGTFQRDVLNREDSDIGMLLSYSWSVGFNYLGGIPKAIDIGYYYGDLIARSITLIKEKNPEAKIHLVTHSMGNRVFFGVFKKLKEAFNVPIIDQHIMAAPDIEPSAFLEGEPLDSIETVVKDLTVYRHNTDRVLTVSGEISENPRLGLVGFSDALFQQLPDMVKIVDCSLINDNETFNISNHNYYYQSPTVRNDIFNVLMEQKEVLQTTRKPLKHSQRFVLQFPANGESN